MKIDQWDEELKKFVHLANENGVRILMVGGGAVNFHGYQRHSADVDFWLDISDENLKKLITVFQKMGYDINDFPTEVKSGQQNISLKFSPAVLDVELITKFAIGKTFDEAYHEAEEITVKDQLLLKWKVLNFEDLIESKKRSARPKDLLDIQELTKRNQ